MRAVRNAYNRGGGVDLIPFDVFILAGATVLAPGSATFGANGQRLYVTFPVSVKGKRAGDRTDSIAIDTPAPPEAIIDRRANGSLTQRALLASRCLKCATASWRSSRAPNDLTQAGASTPTASTRDRLDAVVARQEQALGRQASSLSRLDGSEQRSEASPRARSATKAATSGPSGWLPRPDNSSRAAMMRRRSWSVAEAEAGCQGARLTNALV
jgi:hypothetical protein